MRKGPIAFLFITLLILPIIAIANQLIQVSIPSIGIVSYPGAPEDVLFFTSFEDYTENDEPIDEGVIGKYARGGNVRVNMPGHSVHPYDPSGVYAGTKSIHVWGEKAWRWGYSIELQLPYGEEDAVTGQWLTLAQGRPIEYVNDLVYNQLDPHVRIQDVLPSEYGHYHWERDWIVYDGTSYSWNNGEPLVEPRARLANNNVGELDVVYSRIYFKMEDLDTPIQILRFYSGAASDYVARIQISGEIRLSAYGRNWSSGVGDVDIPINRQEGIWYYLELGFVRGNPGGFRVWFGEAGETPDLLIDLMNLDTSSAPKVDSVQTGIVDIFDSTTSGEYKAVDLYFDDWAIDTSYIGPGGASPPSNQSPVANAGGTYSGNIGQSIIFDGSGSSDSDGTITTYSWTFGDGGTGTGVSTSHTYTSDGTYSVALTVTDNDGATDTDTTTCTIGTAPPEEPPIVFIETSFENEASPIRCEWDGYSPPGFGGDIGDGESNNPDIVEMWVIDENDNPSLGRLPPSFIDGSKCIWGKIMPDPGWSTECYLMHVIVDETGSLNVTWNQMFKDLPSGGDWLPIFWDYVRKKDSTGKVLMYTVPVLQLILTNSQIGVSTNTDCNLDLTAAIKQPYQLQTYTWHKFEFFHSIDAVNGKIIVEIDDVRVYEFTGNTVPTTNQEPNIVYTLIHGFEVGMQYPAINSSTTYQYWLDGISAKNK